MDHGLISDQFLPALTTLLKAFDYATESRVDRWQFAVALKELLARGATTVDVRWLILRGYAEHAWEITVPGDAERSFRRLAPTSFPKNAWMTLTPGGAATLRGKLLDSPQPQIAAATIGRKLAVALAPVRTVPEWDKTRRELRFEGKIIKRYRVPAPNQELVLASFQELEWPEYIDDPLPPSDEQEPKQRLQATIKSLNRNHVHPLIKFHGNGNGRQIHWAVV